MKKKKEAEEKATDFLCCDPRSQLTLSPGSLRGDPGGGGRRIFGATSLCGGERLKEFLTGPRSNCSAHLLMANYFNASKTKNGHETGPQGTDFGLDP